MLSQKSRQLLREGGAHMGFPKCIDTILNRTELNRKAALNSEAFSHNKWSVFGGPVMITNLSIEELNVTHGKALWALVRKGTLEMLVIIIIKKNRQGTLFQLCKLKLQWNVAIIGTADCFTWNFVLVPVSCLLEKLKSS